MICNLAVFRNVWQNAPCLVCHPAMQSRIKGKGAWGNFYWRAPMT